MYRHYSDIYPCGQFEAFNILIWKICGFFAFVYILIFFSGVTEKVIDSAPNTLWRVRVRLENDAGASDWSKEVSIRTSEGAPGTVEGLTARSDGPNSAIVSWNQPIQTNGIITGYAVIYRLKSIGECGPRSSRPITKNVQDEKLVLDGLLPDSTYEIYVIAHTSQAGPQSSPVTFTTEESSNFFTIFRNFLQILASNKILQILQILRFYSILFIFAI